MAHNIASILGRDAIAFLGETPWHKLGTALTGNPSIEEVIRAASLDWNVATQKLFLADGREAPRVAIVRDVDGAILGTASPKYTPIQNAEAFGVLETAVKEHGLRIDVAGALGDGERVWMLAKLANDITIDAQGGADEIAGYLLVDTSHDGTGAHNSRFTPVRVVCNNTLTAATRGSKPFFTIRHTRSAQDRLTVANDMIVNVMNVMKTTGETFAQLAEKRMTEGEIVAYIESVLPTPKNAVEAPATLVEKREAILQLVSNGRGADLAGMTAWGAYNAVTEFVDHVRELEAASEAGRKRAQLAALFGAGNDLKARALDAARELIAA